ITEFSEHEADGCEAEESERGLSEIFPVLCQPAAAAEPPDGAFDDPSFGQNDKAFGSIGTTNDFSDETRQDARESLMEHRPGIGAIGKQLLEERELSEHGGQKYQPTVAVLNKIG